MINFVRRFVPNFADVTAPLVDLTRIEFATRSRFKEACGKTQDTVFAHIKCLLMSARVLKFSDYERESIVHVDASEIGVGAFLAQPSKIDHSMSDLDIIADFSQRFKHGQRHDSASMEECCGIADFSQRFKHGQRHDSASMEECCGVVLTLAHWRLYLFGNISR